MLLRGYTKFLIWIILSSALSSCQLFQRGLAKYEVGRPAYKDEEKLENKNPNKYGKIQVGTSVEIVNESKILEMIQKI